MSCNNVSIVDKAAIKSYKYREIVYINVLKLVTINYLISGSLFACPLFQIALY